MLGNPLDVPDEDLPTTMSGIVEKPAQVTGSSFYGNVTMLPNYTHYRVFNLRSAGKVIRPVVLDVTTTSPVEISINSGGRLLASYLFIQGAPYRVEFTNNFWFDGWNEFNIDIINNEDKEARVGCMLVLHCLSYRDNPIGRNDWHIEHIPTQQEMKERNRIAREQSEIRAKGEDKANKELHKIIGDEGMQALRENKWIKLTGSNGNEYGLNNRQELANITLGKKYCITVGNGKWFPLSDVIMQKMKWCLYDADKVEEVQNESGEFDSSQVEIIHQLPDTIQIRNGKSKLMEISG